MLDALNAGEDVGIPFGAKCFVNNSYYTLTGILPPGSNTDEPVKHHVVLMPNPPFYVDGEERHCNAGSLPHTTNDSYMSTRKNSQLCDAGILTEKPYKVE